MDQFSYLDHAGRPGKLMTLMFLRRLLLAALTVSALVASPRSVAAQPPEGSHLALADNTCATCHGESDLWDKDQRSLYISAESLAKDVHFLNGVNCHDCHGGNPSSFDVPEAHATDVGDSDSGILPFRADLADVRKSCGNCHKKEKEGMLEGIHRKAGEQGEQGAGAVLACSKCHGEKAHGMVSVKDRQSPVYADNQVQLCGNCHEEARKEYDQSGHGRGLIASGLMVTAVCADCHGAHAIYPADDKRSTLNPANVAGTCATCHRFIEVRLKASVHGGAGETVESKSDGVPKRKPSCTDCHQGHDTWSPDSEAFRKGMPGRCGHCHAEQTSGYSISMHGELTDLGYGPAAMCSDCHGAHDILPVSDPASRLSSYNRQATCEKCHANAPRNFAEYDPHADHRDPKRYLLLYLVYMVLITFLVSTFSFFGVHSIIWFVRALIDVFKNGRPKGLKPGEVAYIRFNTSHRVAHTIMAVSFLGLALTGLPLKYSQYEWAQSLAYYLGGYESTGVWHRIFGVMNMSILVLYIVRMMGRWVAGPKSGVSRTSVIFGPDSPVPNLRDVKDAIQMIRWFCGVGPKPTSERWSYWEKYDFWGACADIVAIGLTGLVLWFPYLFCYFLPGQVLNIAKVIHSTQALLATGFVFAVHFFNTHLRPDKFPMDMSVLTGMVSEEEAFEERPDYMERLRQSGQLDKMRTTVPSRGRLLLIMVGGYVALITGLALLVGIMLPLFTSWGTGS